MAYSRIIIIFLLLITSTKFQRKDMITIYYKTLDKQ